MKNKTTILIVVTTIFSICMTLPPTDCYLPAGEAVLDINNARALLRNGNDLWRSGYYQGYIVPQNADPGLPVPNTTALYSGGIWLGGYTIDGNLKMAAQNGDGDGNSDFFAGPIPEDGDVNIETCGNYDRFWSMLKTEIETHLNDYNDNGMIDGPTPESIKAWPGRLNPHFFDIHDFELPNFDYNMAPFVDINGNNIYEPLLGDYPNINGADQGHWTVFNDKGNVHTVSGGVQLRYEIHFLAYSYISDDDAINDATFYDYKFINKNTETLDSLYAGVWADPQLGCFADDYIGCSPEHNMAYVYNSDAVDGQGFGDCSCLPAPAFTYCEEIPLVGIKILDTPLGPKVYNNDGDLVSAAIGQEADTMVELGMSSFMYYNADELNPPPGTDAPEYDEQFYNYLSGTWKDGLPLTYGGDGHNPGGGYANYAFPDNPSEFGGWSMAQEGVISGNRKVLMGIGPFRMAPGEITSMTFSVIYKPNVPHPAPDVTCLETLANEVQGFYDNEIYTGAYTPKYEASTLKVAPNPFTSETQLTLVATDETLQQVQVYSMNGELLKSYTSLSSKSQMIEKGNLTVGLYIYKAVTDGGKVYTGKLMVQ